MLNYVISIYNLTKVALLLYCCSLSTRFIVLLSCFLPQRQFSSTQQDLLVMARGVLEDCRLCQINLIVCCTQLYYCVVVQPLFYLPIVGFICPLVLITNPNILIDAFISLLPFTPKALLALLLYLPKAPWHQHNLQRLCISEILFKTGCSNDSNIE